MFRRLSKEELERVGPGYHLSMLTIDEYGRLVKVDEGLLREGQKGV